MFAALVEPAYQGLVEMYRQSADDMHRILSTSDLSHVWETSNETAWIMEYVYENFNAFKLIVCKAEGTRYESMKEFHLLTTTYIDAVFQAVRHDLTRDEALHYADTLDKFFTLSWKNFFGY